MDRITMVQLYVNRLIDMMPDREEQRIAAVHLYGVSGNCALLALKRGLSPELAAIAGLLHDISTYATGDSRNHAGRSAAMARGCLKSAKTFTQEEMDAVCSAIAHHSDKDKQHAPLDEALKDADVLHHCLHNPAQPPAEPEAVRYQCLLTEITSPA